MAFIRILGALLVIVVLLVPAAASVAAQEQTVDLRPRLRPGEVHRYTMTASTSASGGADAPALTSFNTDISIEFEALTLVANPDGSGIVVVTFRNATLNAGGRTQAIPNLAGTRIEETIDANGQAVDVQVTPAPGGPDRAPLDLTGRLFASGGRQRVGETRESETTFDLPQNLGSLMTRARTTVVGITDVDGTPVAEIDSSVAFPRSTLTTQGVALTLEGSADTTVLTDVASGWVRSGQVTEDLTLSLPLGANQTPVDLAIHVDLDIELVGVSQVRGK